ncbi:hypothetical protein SDC9_83122 [bioreactor metagenome]|uniref:Uncharacterized protein n=1 Tax=bioreactor metagenome TaxID=1076179 RepID=A0A644ZF78_9ZZZZ
MHTDHAHVEGISVAQNACAHDRMARGDFRFVKQRPQLIGSPRGDNSAAEENDRALCLVYQLGNGGNIPRIGLVAGREGLRLFALILTHCNRNILRNVNQYRPRPPGAGDTERAAHSRRKLFNFTYKKVVLRNRHRNAGDINFLKAVFANQAVWDIDGDSHHRNGVHKGVCNTRDEVCRSGTRRCNDDADLSGRSGIAVGSKGRPLLMGCQHMLNSVAVAVELIIHIERAAAWVAEHSVYTMLQ